MSNEEEILSKRSKAAIGANLSFWFPLAAYAEMAASQAIDPVYRAYHEWINYVSIALFCVLVASGFGFGLLAVMRLRHAGRKSGVAWAVAGISFNMVLVGLVAMGISASRTPPLRASAPEQFASTNVTDPKLRRLLSGNSRLQAAFERARSQKSNSLSQLAGPAVDYLKHAQTVQSNYYVAVKPLQALAVLNMADVDDKNDLENRQVLVSNFVNANNQFSEFNRNFDQDFRKMAFKGGLPEETISQQIASLHTKYPQQSQFSELCEANDKWAKGELRALDFLKTNWDEWAYDDQVKKTIMTNDALICEYNKLVAEVNATDKARKQIAQSLKAEQRHKAQK